MMNKAGIWSLLLYMWSSFAFTDNNLYSLVLFARFRIIAVADTNQGVAVLILRTALFNFVPVSGLPVFSLKIRLPNDLADFLA
jgi:hypothetical protein